MRRKGFWTNLKCGVLALGAAVLLAGCGNAEGASPGTETGQAEENLDENQAETAAEKEAQEEGSQEEAENVLGSKGGVVDALESALSENDEDLKAEEEALKMEEARNAAREELAKLGKPVVEIDVQNYGKIVLELDANAAPVSVANFVGLIQDGFYDGLTFHRIMDGFMIQGGDPLGNGTGGSDRNILGEFASNGVENNISHVRGVISMARAMDPNSASSQFFIVQADSVFLDGDYAGFGHVREGMEVVDKICQDAQPIDNNGTIPADAQPVIEKMTVTFE